MINNTMYKDEIPLGKAEDLSNKKFGNLTPLYRVENMVCNGHNQGTTWKCICDCGNISIVRAVDLKRGSYKSCGNKGCYFGGRPIIDLTNRKIGKLLVLEPITKRKKSNGSLFWKCQCDCGNITYVSSQDLTETNGTKSCGCCNSKGELKISFLLKENNIEFTTQKKFTTCYFENIEHLARFDFYIDEKYLIEFDGIQHYQYSGSGWNTEEQFQKTQKRDIYKNQWCRENNIPLIRVPYWKLDTLCIEDLMLETTKFRVV